MKSTIEYEFLQQEVRNIDLNIRELTYDDFLLGDKNIFHGKKMEVIKQRFADPTYKGYGIVEDGLLIYSAWISMKKLGLPVKSNYLLESNEGYLEDDYCHPSFRGRGIHGKVNLYRLARLYEFGKTQCIVIILDGNTPAIKAQIKLGAQDLGCFYAGKVFGIPFVALNKKKYAG
ncbi:MAG: hypothetical protein WCK34_14940 [Bacteroidota bacterium]